jgi:hypothetical protein
MALSWCKVASNLDSHPKIRKAGRLGREVFLFALRRNAEPGNPVPGRLPKYQLDSWYVAEQLQMSESEAVTGVTLAVTHGLLKEEGNSYLIVGFDDAWGKMPASGKDRTAKWRENGKLQKGVTNGDVGDDAKRHGDGGDAREEKRREEIDSPPKGDPRDLALATVLILKVIANYPRNALSRLSPAEKTKRLSKWADHVRLMREVDGHSEAEIRRVIDWCQNDSFWKGNIQSTGTLRDQWDKLVAQMERKSGSVTTIKQAPSDDYDIPPLMLFKEAK